MGITRLAHSCNTSIETQIYRLIYELHIWLIGAVWNYSTGLIYIRHINKSFDTFSCFLYDIISVIRTFIAHIDPRLSCKCGHQMNFCALESFCIYWGKRKLWNTMAIKLHDQFLDIWNIKRLPFLGLPQAWGNYVYIGAKCMVNSNSLLIGMKLSD